MKNFWRRNIIFVILLVIILAIGFLFFSSFEKSIFSKNFQGALVESIDLNEKDISNEMSFLDQETCVDDFGTGVGDSITTEESLQDILDDIAEKLDIISQQVNEIVINQNLAEKEPEEELVEEEDEQQDEDKEEIDVKKEKQEKTEIIYPKILVSGAKIYPTTERFIKLFNPNDIAIDLTGWYLQRKTSIGADFSSCVSKNYFSGKIISPNSYFLISKNDSFANIFMSDLVLTENNSLILKNPSGEISDSFQTGEIPAVVSIGGGGGTISYLKILISEIQTLPIEKRFVELYNPNNLDVDLTGWYLQRKSKTDGSFSTFVSSVNFSEKIIKSNEYFLISRENLENSDIILDIALNEDDALRLKNPSGQETDQVSWQLEPEKNKSLGRKVLEDVKEQDTNDDLIDFEIQIPTPKLQNRIWEEPILPTLEKIEITNLPIKTSYFEGEKLDIEGLVVTGFYITLCDDGEIPFGQEIISNDDLEIIGFDSSNSVADQILTINYNGFTAEYEIEILEPLPPTQLKIISSAQVIISEDFSDIFKIQSQNELGIPTKVLSKTSVNLLSTSSTGFFFDATLDGKCNVEKSIEIVVMKSGSTNKAFCYKDDTPGIFEIKVSADRLRSDFQEIEILDTTTPSDLF